MSVPLADSHLIYIRSDEGDLFATTYDVYPRDGGNQLGWVLTGNRGMTWRATAVSPIGGPFKTGRTRWEAATALWSAAPEGKEA